MATRGQSASGRRVTIIADGNGSRCADGWLAFDTPVYSAWLGEWQTFEQVGSLKWLARQTTPSEQSAVWFVLDAQGTSRGPLTSVGLRELLEADGDDRVSIESAIWSKHIGEWTRMCDLPALRAVWSGE